MSIAGTCWGVYAEQAVPGCRMPAECHGPDGKANARLIAAAPALAEELRNCVESIERLIVRLNSEANYTAAEMWSMRIEPARAALAAAEGRES